MDNSGDLLNNENKTHAGQTQQRHPFAINYCTFHQLLETHPPPDIAAKVEFADSLNCIVKSRADAWMIVMPRHGRHFVTKTLAKPNAV
jgi:hypothetical protein